ncbi:MAG: type II toxin-antitoxin system RelE/ParE family toxin [Rhodomicrobium sp.]
MIALRLVLTAAARKDIAEAQDWYRREGPALAASFREELDRQLTRVLHHPTQFPFARADVRRAKLRRFPYSLLFRVMSDGIYVIACFHSSRDPARWQRRV